MIYIKPPRGDISLTDLHDCVTTRINYFLNKYRQDATVSREEIKFQHLVIGTALDRIGHFILRLLSVHSKLLQEFIVSSEALFITERLEFLPPKDILKLISTSLRHLDEVDNIKHIDIIWKDEMKYILTEIKTCYKNSHMLNFNHNEMCTEYTLKVPFQMCLQMVASRELLMEKGNAVVPCGKWKVFLRNVTEAHLTKEINKLESSTVDFISDQRLKDLKNIILKLLENNSERIKSDSMNASELFALKDMLPPCMGYLYNNLKANHRLSHHARFNFSLFLKDVGMSVNEAIRFWSHEYSKPSKSCKCSHSWQKDSSKFTYGIRHLYGLEGSRANYTTPSCSKIQNFSLGPSEEGGCPFMNFDAERLKKVLHPKVVENEEDLDIIMVKRSLNKSSEVCNSYRRALIKTSELQIQASITEHQSPVQYFLLLRQHCMKDNR